MFCVCIVVILGYNIHEEGTIMKLNEYLKLRRKEMNLTLLDVADVCKVSEATVSRWESGDIENMRRDRIAAYAKALRISPNVIMESEPIPSLVLNEEEEDLIAAYRAAPEGRKDAVRALLNMGGK